VPEEGAIRVQLDGKPICIARSQGEVFALSDICSHADVALSEGDVEDGTIECWLHGSRFDLRTGEPTGLPATEPVATFPVEIRDGDIYVSTTPTNGVMP
jgi:3-phenylpropionate/trans-cinnamate dioxygenase ferredoxin subunit